MLQIVLLLCLFTLNQEEFNPSRLPPDDPLRGSKFIEFLILNRSLIGKELFPEYARFYNTNPGEARDVELQPQQVAFSEEVDQWLAEKWPKEDLAKAMKEYNRLNWHYNLFLSKSFAAHFDLTLDQQEMIRSALGSGEFGKRSPRANGPIVVEQFLGGSWGPEDIRTMVFGFLNEKQQKKLKTIISSQANDDLQLRDNTGTSILLCFPDHRVATDERFGYEKGAGFSLLVTLQNNQKIRCYQYSRGTRAVGTTSWRNFIVHGADPTKLEPEPLKEILKQVASEFSSGGRIEGVVIPNCDLLQVEKVFRLRYYRISDANQKDISKEPEFKFGERDCTTFAFDLINAGLPKDRSIRQQGKSAVEAVVALTKSHTSILFDRELDEFVIDKK